MAKTKKISPDLSTQEKIKEAARKVFMKKGFAATRTRDIAEEAGINLALLNYYFRSKKNLFNIIMAEKLSTFFVHFIPLILDVSTSIEEKSEQVAKNYISFLLDNPDLPIFVLNEIHSNPDHFFNIIKDAEMIQHSPLVDELKKKNPDFKFEHFFMNILALCVFPFVMKPGLKLISQPISKNFDGLMLERIRLIPKWINAMIKVK